MRTLHAYVEGIGLIGPGLDDWTGGRAALLDPAAYEPQPTKLPSPDKLPPAERRRVGRVVKLALGVGLQATAAARIVPAALPSVFTSSGGDGDNCHEICAALAKEDRQISPTRFHNSVHNAAAGYWSIATGAKSASSALCGFDASFTVGLLEAMTQLTVENTPVLLVAYDAQYPPPLYAKRPISSAFGVAFVLAPDARPTAMARLEVGLSDRQADRMDDPRLESLRTSIPAARSLPLLYWLARRQAASVALEYLDRATLVTEIATCR